MTYPLVGLDSQCLSYFLDSIEQVSEPVDALASEKKALVWIWFYMSRGTYFVSETVMAEVARIRAIPRREFHESFVLTLFHDYPVQNRTMVCLRSEELMTTHPRQNDCRILAEAEDLHLQFLLTYDEDFLKRLGGLTSPVKLLKPSSYWKSLQIKRGTEPRTSPHATNPLSRQNWWRW